VGYNFISCDREQQFLMPPSLNEWLPNDHLARFVVDMVDVLDLSAFYARRRADGWGRAAYDPKMMVALLIYAYSTGTRSSRKIETRLIEDVAFRFIAANGLDSGQGRCLARRPPRRGLDQKRGRQDHQRGARERR
jgi:transposase